MIWHAIGFWFDEGDLRAAPVDPRRLVDPTWAEGERDHIVAYLRAGQCDRVYMGYSWCRFTCGIPDNQMGSSTLNDGTWAWPSGLAHYVEEHLIALPEEFLADVRNNHYQVPPEDPLRHYGGTLAMDKWTTWAGNRSALVSREGNR